MSNFLLNWRFGFYHLHILRVKPYISFRKNVYQVELKKNNPNWKWFERY